MHKCKNDDRDAHYECLEDLIVKVCLRCYDNMPALLQYEYQEIAYCCPECFIDNETGDICGECSRDLYGPDSDSSGN